jgi:hypothetical protein
MGTVKLRTVFSYDYPMTYDESLQKKTQQAYDYLRDISEQETYSILKNLYFSVCLTVHENVLLESDSHNIRLKSNEHILVDIGIKWNTGDKVLYYFYTFHMDSDVETPIEIDDLLAVIRKHKIGKL